MDCKIKAQLPINQMKFKNYQYQVQGVDLYPVSYDQIIIAIEFCNDFQKIISNIYSKFKSLNPAEELFLIEMQDVHDKCVEHGAKCASGSRPSYFSTDKAPERAGQGKNMFDNFFSFLREKGVLTEDQAANFTKEAKAEAEANKTTTTVATVNFADTDEYKKMAAKMERMENEKVASEATVFFNDQMRAGRAIPAERK